MVPECISRFTYSRTDFISGGLYVAEHVYLLYARDLPVLHISWAGRFRTRSTPFRNIQPEMETLSKQLHLIEKEKFKSPVLQSLYEKLVPADYPSASASIRDFNIIFKRIEWKSNLVLSPFLAIFLLWDLRIIISLNEWKKKNHLAALHEWLRSAIAEMEVMISIASLIYNEPEWCFPEVDDAYFHLEGKRDRPSADTRSTQDKQ